ncbi:hypothetical protein GCM10020000_85980 [Streptomyces olivoverticillatus]
MAAASLAARRLCRQTAVHPLGVHCAAVGNDPGPQDEALRSGLWRAAEHGATFLDTSDSYGLGHSERLVGQFLKEWTGHRLQVGSKVGLLRGSAEHPYASRRVHHQFEQTIDNLYIEPPLDLYTLASFDFGPADRYLGPAVDQMRVLRQHGDITAIGMRGPYAPLGATMAEWRRQAERFVHLFYLIQPDVVWTRFHALTLSHGAERRGRGPLRLHPAPRRRPRHCRTLRTRRPRRLSPTCLSAARGPSGHLFASSVAAGLKRLRDRFGDAPGTLSRLALRVCLQKADHAAVIFGFRSEEQVEENYSCLGAPLSGGELAAAEAVYARIQADLRSADASPTREAPV